ncbi:BTAD domain-containing putative transcriptional regulator [Streptomyces venetus]|uniref:AfsR/SARP family transcriptional regulator n=1 Tax=Streptomyces venetus TaxID=1701086 RepID=UPI003C30D7AB
MTQPPGYLLTMKEAELDTQRVQNLKAEADEFTAARDYAEAVSCLERALGQWRGPLLAGITRQAWRAEARVWEETQAALQVKKAELQLELGQYESVIAELSAFLPERPFLERPRAQLMTALYRSGRQADALRLYRDTCRLLDEALGIAPGAELQQLHQEILKGALPPGSESAHTANTAHVAHAAPATVSPSPAPSPAPAPSPVGPCLLPSDIGEFVGRDQEMANLVEHLKPKGRNVPIVELVGAGGTGKTTLAIHVGHRQRVNFPDGQLYIDLRGLDKDPVMPEEALARFLREMGVSGPDIPDGLDQRAEKFRALLTDKRVLIILDNASEANGIRPLLPGTDRCAVIVTSRSRVASSFSAQVVELGGLPMEQALELLYRSAGRERSAAEQGAARQLVEYCGHLPLAVGIVGAKLAAKPHWTMHRAAQRLADERRRLDELEHDSLTVRSTFELSYNGISADAQLLLRRLSVLAAPDFADWFARHLVGLDWGEAENLVEELVDARLIEVMGRDRAGQLRYRLHDLVRLFGSERADGESESQRRDAVARTARAALARADVAHRTVCGGDYTVVRSGAAVPGSECGFAKHEDVDPLRWSEVERTTLTTMVRQAAGYGFHDVAWDLAAVCRCLFSTRAHYDDWLATHQHALAAVRRAGDRKGEAALLLGLGDLYLDKRDYGRAAVLLERAHTAFIEVGEEYGAALALRKAACVDRIVGRYEQALERWRESLPVFSAHGDLQARAQVLRWLGLTLLELHDRDGAEPYLRQAEEVTRSFAGRSAGQVRLALADLLRARRRLDEAEAEYARGQELAEALGDVFGIGYAQCGLGVVALERGQRAEGRRLLGTCLESARAVGDPLLEALSMFCLAVAFWHEGRLDRAEELLLDAASLYRDLGTPVRYARCLHAVAGVIEQQGGDPTEAADLRARAAAAVAGTGSPLAAKALGPKAGPRYPLVL